MLKHTGPARVFESEEEVSQAIYSQQIKKGDVVVIRYEGPKGGPGMREMLGPTSAIAGMGPRQRGGFITDDVSAELRGALNWTHSPEAAEGTHCFVREGIC